ncbi:MAG: DUF427 domain-containing protein [Kineosporiaceae bacterium]
MALTFPPGPLSAAPGAANYVIDGPAHRILLTPTAKRIRVLVGDGAGAGVGETVLDTTAAVILHETNLMPRYYVPWADVHDDVLVPSDTVTHCPFKGDASYRSVRVGQRVVEDLLWTYEVPNPELPGLAGLAGLYLEKLDTGPGPAPLDAVLEEDEPVLGHPRDPFHRVDARPSSRHVEVVWTRPDGTRVTLADTTRPVGVFETSLPPRWYVPVDDVRTGLLRDSQTLTVCPYKGVATYRSLVDGPPDVAWGYEDPLAEATLLPGHLAFAGDGVSVLVDGREVG